MLIAPPKLRSEEESRMLRPPVPVDVLFVKEQLLIATLTCAAWSAPPTLAVFKLNSVPLMFTAGSLSRE